MKQKSLVALLLSIALIGLSGCASYQVRPDAASITIPRAQSPIPVKVGIVSVQQNLTGGFSDVVQNFKSDLDQSQLFREVYYPVRPTDQFDGEISLVINTRFKMDTAWFPKAFFTGFFMLLPTPIVVYNHHYQAECTLDLVRNGKALKTYKGDGTVMASHKLFAPEDKLEAEGTQAATKALSADLIGQLINDRAFLEKELVSGSAATSQ